MKSLNSMCTELSVPLARRVSKILVYITLSESKCDLRISFSIIRAISSILARMVP